MVDSGEGRIAEITSDRTCLSPFTKDNRGCGLLNANLTNFCLPRGSKPVMRQGCLRAVVRGRGDGGSALGGVAAACHPSGDNAKCGASSRAWSLVRLSTQGLSRSRQRFATEDVFLCLGLEIGFLILQELPKCQGSCIFYHFQYLCGWSYHTTSSDAFCYQRAV